MCGKGASRAEPFGDFQPVEEALSIWRAARSLVGVLRNHATLPHSKGRTDSIGRLPRLLIYLSLAPQGRDTRLSQPDSV